VELYELGYRISSKDGSILLPGDVRDYNYCGYPDFVYSGAGGTDLCISHLWAGKNALDESAYMPVIKAIVPPDTPGITSAPPMQAPLIPITR
jgi:hypothetical protein